MNTILPATTMLPPWTLAGYLPAVVVFVIASLMLLLAMMMWSERRGAQPCTWPRSHAGKP